MNNDAIMKRLHEIAANPDDPALDVFAPLGQLERDELSARLRVLLGVLEAYNP